MQTVVHPYLSSARAVIEAEAKAVHSLKERLSQDFIKAVDTILACKGRLIVLGLGKSGHIGAKIAATLASTGTPSFFVHAGEASHGDLGMITKDDVMLAISYSGETHEMLGLLPPLKRFGIPLIAMTGNQGSTLAKNAHIHLDVSVEKEACSLGLAPTSSTTVTLVMGDALAICLLESRGFSKEDFAFSHPGGSLGKRLLLTVKEIMHQGDEVPSVSMQATLQHALIEMTRTHLGATSILDEAGRVLGIFTDGDLRRAFEKNIGLNTPISEVMTPHCTTIGLDSLAAEALRIMEAKKINALLVVDPEGVLAGALNMHDLLRVGIL